MQKFTKLFTLAFKSEIYREYNLYNMPLDAIYHKLRKDCGVAILFADEIQARDLLIDETLVTELNVFGLTYSITRTK